MHLQENQTYSGQGVEKDLLCLAQHWQRDGLGDVHEVWSGALAEALVCTQGA